MTDNEIIKALECCTKGNTSDVCADCPLLHTDICTEEENGVLKLALDLINRQKSEIDELQHRNSKLQQEISGCKAEAVKEFAEQVKRKVLALVWTVDVVNSADYIKCIDNLVKEMVGEG